MQLLRRRMLFMTGAAYLGPLRYAFYAGPLMDYRRNMLFTPGAFGGPLKCEPSQYAFYAGQKRGRNDMHFMTGRNRGRRVGS